MTTAQRTQRSGSAASTRKTRSSPGCTPRTAAPRSAAASPRPTKASHAAAAVALGWHVNSVEIKSVDSGRCWTDPPAGRGDSRLDREELIFVMAPAALGAKPPGWRRRRHGRLAPRPKARWRAGALVGGAGRGRKQALLEAEREVRRLAAAPSFQRVRSAIRELLLTRDRIDRAEITLLSGGRQEGAESLRPRQSSRAAEPVRKANRRCAGCDRLYTPRHASGRCFRADELHRLGRGNPARPARARGVSTPSGAVPRTRSLPRPVLSAGWGRVATRGRSA